MKTIQITQCSKPGAWHGRYIGKKFTVTVETDKGYKVINGSLKNTFYVPKQDATEVKPRLPLRQRLSNWYYSRPWVNKFKLWYYQAEIEMLISLFDSEKYSKTGIALTPEQLVAAFKEKGIRPATATRLLKFTTRMGIIEDHPVGTGNKKFMYMLNSQFLKA